MAIRRTGPLRHFPTEITPPGLAYPRMTRNTFEYISRCWTVMTGRKPNTNNKRLMSSSKFETEFDCEFPGGIRPASPVLFGFGSFSLWRHENSFVLGRDGF